MSELIEGQIYRWRWADEARHLDGLRSDMGSERALAMDEVQLTLLCDTSWPVIQAWRLPYYDPSDIVDTRHPNSSGAPIYLRPEAGFSPSRLIEEIAYREEKARSEIRSAERALERLTEARLLVDAGRFDEVLI